MRIRFDEIDGFIRTYDGARCLTLFDPEKYDAIYDGIRYVISLKKSNIVYIFSHYFPKIKFDSFDSLSIKERLTLRDVIIRTKSVLNKDKNQYYYKIFLQKFSY